MKEIISCFLIAVALSMDTFSLSLGLGTNNVDNYNSLKLSIVVGMMHFIMPFFGNILGSTIVNFFALNSNKLLGIILIFIASNLLVSIAKDEEIKTDFSLLGIFFFAFGVSIDAFSTGIGLKAITNNELLALIIFALTSFLFTFVGLKIGNFASKLLGKKANIFGIILLFSLGIYHFCQ